MPPVLSCVNLKGGVGKTALAVNFAAYCGTAGRRTLLIDLDPQTNATFSCISVDEWQNHAAEHGTVADLFGVRNHTSAEGSKRTFEDVVRRGVFPNVDLIPSHLDLFTIDLDLAGATARETKLGREIEAHLSSYDIVVCDCPPNLTIPTQNAIALSSHYVVPVSPDYLSSIGVALLISRVKELSGDLRKPLEHAGIVVSRVGRTAQHREQTIAALHETFGDLVLSTHIVERVAVSQSAAQNKPVYESGDDAAATEFRRVSSELLRRIGVGAPVATPRSKQP